MNDQIYPPMDDFEAFSDAFVMKAPPMEPGDHPIDHSLAEMYTRFSGHFVTDSHEVRYYEYGEYPVPADDGYDDLIFAVYGEIDWDELIDLGVAHLEWCRHRWGKLPGWPETK